MQHISKDQNYLVKIDFVSVKENKTKTKTGKNKAVLSLTTSRFCKRTFMFDKTIYAFKLYYV